MKFINYINESLPKCKDCIHFEIDPDNRRKGSCKINALKPDKVGPNTTLCGKMKLKKYITESSKEQHTGIFIGRMQGLTVGHTKVIDIMSKAHPHSYIVLVKGEKSSQDTKHNPLPYEMQKKMIERILPDNVEFITAKTANLENILPDLDGKDFVVYAGPDRLQDYRGYAKYAIKLGYKVQVIDTGQMIPRDDSISGTKLRQALKDNDIEAFKKIAPKEIWDMFNDLREYIK